jgi:hypothetical protein
MKKKLLRLSPPALAAIGVFLGRGAQADTIIDFDGVGTNIVVPEDFGDNAVDSSVPGVSVVDFGTPNIGLSWPAPGGAWHFYLDGVWQAGQLDDSYVGDTHSVIFTPNNPGARVVVKSFNFHPYYDSTERFAYSVSLLAGATVVSGPTTVTFKSDATKDHTVDINHTGALGQELELRLERVASTLEADEIEGDGYNIAVDDITFAQLPAMPLIPGPQVTAVSPADGESGAPAVYSFRATISNGETAVVPGSIQLKLDGVAVSPAPTISPAGEMTEVSFQAPGLLASGSTHTYALSYNDTAVPPSSYTKEVRFTAANYPTRPANYASAPASASGPGFTYRSVLAVGAPTLPSTLDRAKAQLAGTLLNPDTQEPFENGAEVGPNPDGSFDVETVLDFDDDGAISGHFDKDTLFPGLPTSGNNWFATKANLFLDLPTGYYRLGVNSDDGFEASVGIPVQGEMTSQIVLGLFDNGRAAGDTLFDFLVQTPGIYRFQIIFFESDGAASCEFYSVDLSTGDRILVNDLANPKAIKSFRSLSTATAPPRITSIVRSGSDVIVQWIDGTPPFQVQLSSTLATGSWTNNGPPTPNRTATIPMQPGGGFIRVVDQ